MASGVPPERPERRRHLGERAQGEIGLHQRLDLGLARGDAEPAQREAQGLTGHQPEVLVAAHQRAQPRVLELLLAPEQGQRLRVRGHRARRLHDRVDVEQRPVGVEDEGARRGHPSRPRTGPPASRAEPGAAGRLRGSTRRRGRGRGLEAGLVEAVAEDGLRVAEGEAAGLGAQRDQDELLARLPGGDREVVARLAGEAGLERLHATRIAEQRDVPAVDPPAVHERRPPEERARGGIVVEEPADELGEVLGGRALVGVGQAVRVGVVRVRQAQLLGLGVHRGHEGLLGTAEVLGHRGGGVVGGGDGHALSRVRRGTASPVRRPMR